MSYLSYLKGRRKQEKRKDAAEQGLAECSTKERKHELPACTWAWRQAVKNGGPPHTRQPLVQIRNRGDHASTPAQSRACAQAHKEITHYHTNFLNVGRMSFAVPEGAI
eukprot:1159089-Pelagomonas_calceolata.AAC.8